VSGRLATHATFLRRRVAANQESVHVGGVHFGDTKMLPTFLLLTVFSMPVALAVMAIVGARAERRLITRRP
jgi:hypothetical protein